MIGVWKKKGHRNEDIHEYLSLGLGLAEIFKITNEYSRLVGSDNFLSICKAVIGEELSAPESRLAVQSFPHDALEMYVISSLGRIIQKTQAIIRSPVHHRSDEQSLPDDFKDSLNIRRSFLVAFHDLKLSHQEERISLDAVINEIFKLADYYQYFLETGKNSKRVWDDFDRFYLNQVA